MTFGSCSDEEALVRQQYKSQDNLQARLRTHERYSVPRVDFTAWVLDRITWQGDEVVLDAGCGAGAYVEAVRQRTPYYLAGDLSFGMLHALAQPGTPRINLDAQQLPLAAESVDVILANHMLYHVPARGTAVREFARVLRPGGRLMAATNSAHNMAELDAIGVEVGKALGLAEPPAVRPTLSFTLENGEALLSRHFNRVERHDLPGALVFPEPQPLIDYLASMCERYVPFLPARATWEDVVAVLRRLLAAEIAERGEFRVNKLAGVFVCWNEEKL